MCVFWVLGYLQSELDSLDSQGNRQELEERFEQEVGPRKQNGRARCYGRAVTQSRIKEASMEKTIQEQVEIHRRNLDDSVAEKLREVREAISAGLQDTIKLLQAANPEMVIPEGLLGNLMCQNLTPSDAGSARLERRVPSSRAANSRTQVK